MVMIKGAFFAAVLALATCTSARPVYKEYKIAQRDVNDLGVRYVQDTFALVERAPDVKVLGVRSVPKDASSYQMINKRQISAEVATKTDANGNIVVYDPSAQKRDQVPEIKKRQGISAEVATKTDANGNIVVYDPSANKRDVAPAKRQNQLTGSEEAVKAPQGRLQLYERQIPEEVPTRSNGAQVQQY